MIPPTWGNVCQVIGDGDGDLDGIAYALGLDRSEVGETLQEMVDKALLFRWSDNGVTRYGVCRDGRGAA